MCGIAGIVRESPSTPVDEDALLRMAGAIRHRGPDGFGLLLDDGAGLVSARLAIVDLASGWQPLRSGPGGSVLVYNGEVYNHPELRSALRGEGVEFETHSDTEVVQAVLEHRGLAGLDDLNGQFALAWWQPEPRRLTLIRDRFGVRPLHYALDERGSLIFGSEAKALFASGEVSAAPDPAGLDEVFTLWAPQSPRTTFDGISQVEAGGLLIWERGRIVERRRWWSADPHDQPGAGAGIEELLRDSVNLRLRADVQVGAYLSGGLDSSLISALAQVEQRGELTTFSVAFDDPGYDERAHQETVARAIGTRHHVLEIGSSDIAGALPEVIGHAETPLIRTAPVPCTCSRRTSATTTSRSSRRGRAPMSSSGATTCSRRLRFATSTSAIQSARSSFSAGSTRTWARRRGAGPGGRTSCSRPGPTTIRSPRT